MRKSELFINVYKNGDSNVLYELIKRVTQKLRPLKSNIQKKHGKF